MPKRSKSVNMKLIENEKLAIQDYEDNKRLNIQDIKPIKALTAPQKLMFESYFSGNGFIFANGTAGTGKSFAALYLALTDVLNPKSPQNSLIIVKSAVPSREIGFLPGNDAEKLEPYEKPYEDIFSSLFGRPTAYKKMKKQKVVSFMPTSFVRGLTWDNAVVVVDEIQNMTFQEINSVITRTGANTKLIVIGDRQQNDLYRHRNDTSGMESFERVAAKIEEFDHILFTKNDIVRGAFVRSWICAMEETGISF